MIVLECSFKHFLVRSQIFHYLTCKRIVNISLILDRIFRVFCNNISIFPPLLYSLSFLFSFTPSFLYINTSSERIIEIKGETHYGSEMIPHSLTFLLQISLSPERGGEEVSWDCSVGRPRVSAWPCSTSWPWAAQHPPPATQEWVGSLFQYELQILKILKSFVLVSWGKNVVFFVILWQSSLSLILYWWSLSVSFWWLMITF